MEAVKRIYICLSGKRLSIKTPPTRWSSLRPGVISDPRAIVAPATVSNSTIRNDLHSWSTPHRLPCCHPASIRGGGRSDPGPLPERKVRRLSVQRRHGPCQSPKSQPATRGGEDQGRSESR